MKYMIYIGYFLVIIGAILMMVAYHKDLDKASMETTLKGGIITYWYTDSDGNVRSKKMTRDEFHSRMRSN